NFCPDDVAATWRAKAAVALARPVSCRGHGVAPDQPAVIVEGQCLVDDADPDRLHGAGMARRPRKNSLSMAPHSSAMSPPSTVAWWLSRVSANRLTTLPQAPVLGSGAP